jgi:hypothetical protein
MLALVLTVTVVTMTYGWAQDMIQVSACHEEIEVHSLPYK